jgi:hypothetical protein
VCSKQQDNTSILQLFPERFADGRYSLAVDARAEQGVGSASAVLAVDTNNNTLVALPQVVIPTQPKLGCPASVET